MLPSLIMLQPAIAEVCVDDIRKKRSFSDTDNVHSHVSSTGRTAKMALWPRPWPTDIRAGCFRGRVHSRWYRSQMKRILRLLLTLHSDSGYEVQTSNGNVGPWGLRCLFRYRPSNRSFFDFSGEYEQHITSDVSFAVRILNAYTFSNNFSLHV
jgi:hypothetical protein